MGEGQVWPVGVSGTGWGLELRMRDTQEESWFGSARAALLDVTIFCPRRRERTARRAVTNDLHGFSG